MSQKEQQDISFDCSAFREIMKAYEQDLNRDKDDTNQQLFSIPDYLESIVNIYLFHEKSKKVLFKNVPENVMLVDMVHDPKGNIEKINHKIQTDTNGFLTGLDDSTKDDLSTPEFRCLLMGILYLKASWDGETCESYPFHNKNGEIINNIPFFKLTNVVYFIDQTKNGLLCVDVSYSDNDKFRFKGNFVRFSKPINVLKNKSLWFSYIDEIVVAYIPKLDVQGRQEMCIKNGHIVMTYRYKQDEKGFEAACLYSRDGVDGAIKEKNIKKIYFNEPFTIEIFSNHQKVFEINVNNLNEE